MKKQLINFSLLLVSASVLFIGCQKSETIEKSSLTQPNNNSGHTKDAIAYCGTPIVANLVDFEQTINAGTVTVGNDSDKLYVSYALTGDWWIQNATLYVGPAANVPGDMNPDGSGNFTPWYPYFPYYYYPWDFVQNYTFAIDLSTLDDCFVVIAYSNAKNLVTGQNKYIWGKSVLKYQGYYLEYCKQSCTPPPPPLGGCETGYAYGNGYANCFLNIPNVQSNNWGWSNGQITYGTYTWPIYAGAGQCNIGNGIPVGTLQVTYTSNHVAVVKYQITEGYILNETHLYVGNTILPMKKNKYTTAPGQFPYKHENLNGASSDTYTITGLTGAIYIAAHSVVCDDL
jgi:hypothetical protein